MNRASQQGLHLPRPFLSGRQDTFLSPFLRAYLIIDKIRSPSQYYIKEDGVKFVSHTSPFSCDLPIRILPAYLLLVAASTSNSLMSDYDEDEGTADRPIPTATMIGVLGTDTYPNDQPTNQPTTHTFI